MSLLSSSKWGMGLSLGLLLLALGLLAYGHLLQSGALPYSPHSDLLSFHLAWKQVAYESVKRGQGLPLWRTDLLSGGPALTNPQALFTHPLQLLFLVVKPAVAAGPTLWLHVLFMALSMWVLGSMLGLAYWGRGLMAVAGLFSFKLILIVYAGWLSVLAGFVAAPLLFAAVFRILDRPSPGAALFLAVAASLGLHGGHLQIFYYSTLLLGAYIAVRVLTWTLRGEPGRAARVALWCVIGAIPAVCSAAYLLLPLAAETGLSSRSAASYALFLSRGAYAPAGLLTFLYPEALGTPLNGSYGPVELWEDVAYFGAVPEVLAVLGALWGWRRRHVRFLAIAFSASLLLVFDSPVLRLLFEYVPGFSLFRLPTRFLFLTTLLGIALAGVGLEELLQRARYWRPTLRLPWLPHALAATLVLVVVAEGGIYARRYLHMAPADQLLPSPQYARLIARDTSAFRVAPIGRYTVNYGWGAFLGLDLVTGYDPYNYRHYRQYFELMRSNAIAPEPEGPWVDLDRVARWDLLDALNVKYLLAPGPIPGPPRGLELIASFDDEPVFAFYRGLGTAPIYVYENRNALPRAYWAKRVRPARDAAQALELVSQLDPREVTVVESSSGEPVNATQPPDHEIRIVERSGGHLVLETRSARRGFAVVAEVWHPGWRATLDGEPAELLRADVAMMGAWVPAGEHRLELRFAPLHWWAARVVSVAGLVGMLGLGALAVRDARRRSPASSS